MGGMKINANGWSSMNLFHNDAAGYEILNPVDGIISTFPLAFLPDGEPIIKLARKRLKPDRSS